MGADRAVLVTDEAAAGSDLVATSRILAAVLEREGADLILFGQQSSDSDGAVLWSAVADRLRLPVVSQVAELEIADGKVKVKRQTEFGYDVIEAPLPAVVAVSDAINEPRFPSLKGIMGAKSKPQETLSLGRPRARGRRGRRGGLAHRGATRSTIPPRARGHASRSRTTARRAQTDRRLPRREEARCEHPRLPRAPRRRAAEGRARRALEGRARSATTRRGRHRRLRRERRSPPAPGAYGAKTVYVVDDAALEAPLAAAAGRRSSPRSCRRRASTPSSSRSSVLAADVAAGLAARLDAGLNWDLVDLVARGRRARREASRAQRLGVRRRRLDVASRASRSSARARSIRPRAAGRPTVQERQAEIQDFSTGGHDGRAGARGVRGAVDRGRGRSIVAGGRGLGAPEGFSLVEDLAKALGGAVARDARGRRRRLVPVRDAGRPDRARPSRRSSTSPAGSPGRSSTRSGCRART